VQVGGCEEGCQSTAEQPDWGSHLLYLAAVFKLGLWPWSWLKLCCSHACVLADLEPVPET